MSKIKAITTSAAVLGQVLSKLRQRAGLKQADISTAVGITPSTWSRIEKGESSLSIDQLKQAAKSLSMSAGEVLDIAQAAEGEIVKRGVVINYSLSPQKTLATAIKSGVLGQVMTGNASIIPLVGNALSEFMDNVFDEIMAKRQASG